MARLRPTLSEPSSGEHRRRGLIRVRHDVFNGDADGICALHQLRLSLPPPDPGQSRLITGLKREIALLDEVRAAPGERVTVLDISLDRNREALHRLLDGGVEVEYFDHHFAGEIPRHPAFTAHIDPSADTCTSLLVDQRLEGAHRAWAVVGAFGDNLHESARRAAATLDLNEAELEGLCELGTLLNYNGYGVSLSDLHYHPAELYRALQPHSDPRSFIAEAPAFEVLREGFASDIAHAEALEAGVDDPHAALYVLPDETWARRISGVFGNRLARSRPRRAHALATRLSDGYRISIRAPLDTRSGADELARLFPGGGGRRAAAGIDHLPDGRLEEFLERFQDAFRR